jgi:transposase-like protein
LRTAPSTDPREARVASSPRSPCRAGSGRRGRGRLDAVACDHRLVGYIPFPDYDVEIRRIICSTNPIESLNARYRRAIRASGHFPTEQAALKCLYLVTRSLDPTGRGRARWAMRWKPALNALAITFEGRIVASGLN